MRWSLKSVSRSRTRVVAALGIVAVSGSLLIAGACSAAAAETYLRPASGVFTLDGRGFGHGIGMSQYGANGAAQGSGGPAKTWSQIMGFSYPGTGIGDNGNPLMRVKLTGLNTLPVVAQPGLRMTLNRTGSSTDTWETLPSVVRSNTVGTWDVAYYSDTVPAAPNYTGWWVRFRWVGDTTWRNYKMSPSTATAVAFDNPSGTVRRLTGTTAYSTYRGELRHTRSANTASASVSIVDALPMESYLRGVVPNEMPASWATEAVRSQAVAARTYAEYERRHAPSTRVYDICDSTACQVMRPVETEDSRSDQAIKDTAGKIVTYQGSAAFTQFSASNGGYSVTGSQPYLTAHADPYDAYTWTASVSAATIQSAWPAVGRLTSMTLTRDGRGSWGGRVASVALSGTGGSVTVTGGSFTSTLGLRSPLFKPQAAQVSSPSFPNDVTGDRKADVLAIAPGGALRVYPGSGTGTFAPVRTAAASGWSDYTRVFTSGTWDQGAVGDVMAVTIAGSLQWFRGRGDGTFDPGVQIATGFEVYNLLTPIGDVNGDGGTDLLGRRADGTLWLVEGTGQGQILTQVQIGNGWDSYTAIFSPGDFNGDGRADVIGRDSAGNLWLFAGTGDGHLRAPVRIGQGWGPFTTIYSNGDFSGDGKADVIGRSQDGRLWLYRGSGTGGFGAHSQIGNGWNGLTLLP
jgi:stage II sporulation protein D